MATKTRVVKVEVRKKRGFLKKIIWSLVALIGFLSSLIAVIEFVDKHKDSASKIKDKAKEILEEIEGKNKPSLEAQKDKKEEVKNIKKK